MSEVELPVTDAGLGDGGDAGEAQPTDDPAPMAQASGSFSFNTFLKGNVHTHSTRSDGRLSPEAMRDLYASAGYDFLAMSDHDFASWSGEFDVDRLRTISGEEVSPKLLTPEGVTLYPHIGSICGDGTTVGVRPDGSQLWLGSPALPSPDATRESALAEILVSTIRDVRTRGAAIPILNHPNFRRALSSRTLLRVLEQTSFNLLEMANQNDAVETLPDATHEGDEEIWDVLLTAGYAIYGIASDDAHNAQATLQGFIGVAAETNETQAICDAIARGAFYSSTGIELRSVTFDGHALAIEINVGAHDGSAFSTSFIGDGGEVIATTSGALPAFDASGRSLRYVRATVSGPTGKAWVQPVFLPAR